MPSQGMLGATRAQPQGRHEAMNPLVALQPSADWLARQRFGSTAYRLIFLLMAIGHERGQNIWIRVTQAEAASQLGLDASSISRALRELETGLAIERGPRIAGAWTWRINPRLLTGSHPAPMAQVLEISTYRVQT